MYTDFKINMFYKGEGSRRYGHICARTNILFLGFYS